MSARPVRLDAHDLAPSDVLDHLEPTGLRPPKSAEDIKTGGIRWPVNGDAERAAWYCREYNAGWQAGGRRGHSAKWDSGQSSWAWDDGYLDRVAGRDKWHLTYCPGAGVCWEH